ncbi:hypothetical protein FOA52_009959 [Chlamydomonas sp. UWO 241]|nr:hypothetical protein FOA52_009959 [Chlamydomonas sp. UWO 241]
MLSLGALVYTVQLALCLLVIAAIAFAAAAWAKGRSDRKHKRAMLAAQARWERDDAELRLGVSRRAKALLASLSQTRHGGGGGGADGGSSGGPPVVLESFTLGWLNMLVQATWAPVLERLVSAFATEKLQAVLNEVLEKAGKKPPWKYIDHFAVDEVTLGLAPPQFHNATAKYDAAKQYLQIQLDIKYVSSGFQAMLSPRIAQIGMLKAFALRFEVTQLVLSGRLSLGLQLSPDAPGIRGVEYSFLTGGTWPCMRHGAPAEPHANESWTAMHCQEPHFEIQASPLGLSGMAGELPGLISSLRAALLKAMSKKVVEPHRKFLDVAKLFHSKYVMKSGGPGGLLTVTVIGARDVGPRSASGGVVDPFVEMRMGRQVFRTPVVHDNATSPLWNWPVHTKLAGAIPFDASAHGRAEKAAQAAAATALLGPVLKSDSLHFTVHNAMCMGEPEVLCCGKVALRQGGLPARVGDASLRLSFVASISVEDAIVFVTGGDGCGHANDVFSGCFADDAEEARRRAANAAAGVSMPVRLATNIVRFMHDNTGNWDGPAGGGVVSASFINAKPAVGGIGVEPRGGGVLRVLFTVASSAVADTVVRWRWKLRQMQVAVFDVLSNREEARHRALWPAFLAAKAAGKRAQFHRACLVVDGERVAALVC